MQYTRLSVFIRISFCVTGLATTRIERTTVRYACVYRPNLVIHSGTKWVTFSGEYEANMDPEPYTENPEQREIALSEREVNALLEKNSEMGEKLVLDFSDDLMSAKLLMPLDPDLPFFGGKTLRASTGVAISVQDGIPSVILKGVSVWGVPVPNAWLGGLKNVDLVNEFGDEGSRKSFSEGIEDVEIREGELKLKLRE